MKITIKGYPPIVVPAELAQSESGAFDGQTPYVAKLSSRLHQPAYRLRTLPAKLLCLEAIKGRMESLGGYKTFSEPLAGVGLSARIFDKGKTYLNELDPSCRRVLELNFGEKSVTSQNAMVVPFKTVDAIFLDFNDFTLKRFCTTTYGEVLQRAFASAQKYVILNDCSVFYFRYGKSSYKAYEKYVEEPITCLEEYFKALRRFYVRRVGWNLLHVAYFRDTSFQLFGQVKEKLQIEEIKNPKAIVEVSGLC